MMAIKTGTNLSISSKNTTPSCPGKPRSSKNRATYTNQSTTTRNSTKQQHNNQQQEEEGRDLVVGHAGDERARVDQRVVGGQRAIRASNCKAKSKIAQLDNETTSRTKPNKKSRFAITERRHGVNAAHLFPWRSFLVDSSLSTPNPASCKSPLT